MNSCVAKICCFKSADLTGEFTQIVHSSSNYKRFDPHNEMTPMVSASAEENGQVEPAPADSNVSIDTHCLLTISELLALVSWPEMGLRPSYSCNYIILKAMLCGVVTLCYT